MIGIDIIDHSRFKISDTSNHRLLSKFLSSTEIDQLNNLPENKKLEYMSSRFAAKEATVKALKGKLIKYIYSDHFSILRVKNSPPNIIISNEFTAHLQVEFNASKIEISISHDKSISVAIAMLV